MKDRLPEHRRALWWSKAGLAGASDPLDPDATADVAVIGGGFTGLTAAWHLARRGLRVALLEAAAIGSGASGVNAGFVVPNFAKVDPAVAIEKLGRDRGEALLRLVGGGGDRVFETIRAGGIECDAERTGWLNVAHSTVALATLRKRAESWRDLGRPVRLLGEEEARALTGARLCFGALLDESGGTIDPLSYARGLARLARAAGASVHEGVLVRSAVRDGDLWRLDHAHGAVRAPRVLLCTNAFASGVAGRMARGIIPLGVYQIATEPLPEAEALRIAPQRHPVADVRANLFTYRLDRDGRLISGGMSMLPIAAHGRMSRMIAKRLKAELGLSAVPPVAHVWTGRAAMTTDFLPRVFEFGPGFVGGIGCNGRGIALTAMLGEVLADAACGKPLAELPVPGGALRPVPLPFLARLAPTVAIAEARLRDGRALAKGARPSRP